MLYRELYSRNVDSGPCAEVDFGYNLRWSLGMYCPARFTKTLHRALKEPEVDARLAKLDTR